MEGNAAPNDRLEEARGHMLSLAHQAGEVQKACGLDVVPEDFCRETLKFGLMEVCHIFDSHGLDSIIHSSFISQLPLTG